MNEHWRYDECSVAFYHEGIETDMYKVVDALNAAEFRIAELEAENRNLMRNLFLIDDTEKIATLNTRNAELEGLVDKLIEVGDELADDREYQDDLVDIWHDLVRDYKAG